MVSGKKSVSDLSKGGLFIAHVAVYSQRLSRIPLENVCVYIDRGSPRGSHAQSLDAGTETGAELQLQRHVRC